MSDKERVTAIPETEKKSPSIEQKISDMNAHMGKLNDATFLKALKVISNEVEGDFTKILDSDFFSNLLSEIQKRRAVFDSRLTDSGIKGLNRYIDEINSRLGLTGEQGLAKFGNPKNEVIAESVVTETIQSPKAPPSEVVVPNEAPEAADIESTSQNAVGEVAAPVEQALTPEVPAQDIENLKSDLDVLRLNLTELESTILRITTIGKKYEFDNDYMDLHKATASLGAELQSSLANQLNLVDQMRNAENPDIDQIKELIREIESGSVSKFRERTERLVFGLRDLLPVIDIPAITDDINSMVNELDYAIKNLENITATENQLAGQYL